MGDFTISGLPADDDCGQRSVAIQAESATQEYQTERRLAMACGMSKKDSDPTDLAQSV